MKVELPLARDLPNGTVRTRRTCSRTRSKSSQVIIRVLKNRKVKRQQSSMVVGLSQYSPSSVLRFTFITKRSLFSMLKQHQNLSLTFFACVNLLLINNEFYERNHGKSRVFAIIKATIDYASGKKITLYSAGKNTVIAAGADVVYDYGKKNGYWPWSLK